MFWAMQELCDVKASLFMSHAPLVGIVRSQLGARELLKDSASLERRCADGGRVFLFLSPLLLRHPSLQSDPIALTI